MKHWPVVMVGLAVVLLSGCAATRVTERSDSGVKIVAEGGLGEAQMMADEECGKSGRIARWVSGDETFVFACE